MSSVYYVLRYVQYLWYVATQIIYVYYVLYSMYDMSYTVQQEICPVSLVCSHINHICLTCVVQYVIYVYINYTRCFPCTLASLPTLGHSTATASVVSRHLATHCNTLQHTATHCKRGIKTYIFLDGYCSTLQDSLDWFEVDIGFTKLCLFRYICALGLSNCKCGTQIYHTCRIATANVWYADISYMSIIHVRHV